jgi:hypothetical protein
VGTPNEILLYTLRRYSEDQNLSSSQITREFLTQKYGKRTVRFLEPAFGKAYDIISSSFYTLGTNMSNHSKLDYDPYKSSYGRHVSGKWLEPPVVFIAHGVNREKHYWTDVIEHLSPARFKTYDGPLLTEAPQVISNKWVTPEEKMNEEYLRYIITEKKYGVRQAEKALRLVSRSEKVMKPEDFEQVYELFNRTLITARAYEAAATAYFGYRIYARGTEFRNDWLIKTMNEALATMPVMATIIENYDKKVPRGQWNWRGDAATLRKYHEKITQTGWQEYGNVIFEEYN